jgi:hypothetical protein
MNFVDTYAGLDDIWHKVEVDAKGNVDLKANADGFEHLARYFSRWPGARRIPGTTAIRGRVRQNERARVYDNHC